MGIKQTNNNSPGANMSVFCNAEVLCFNVVGSEKCFFPGKSFLGVWECVFGRCVLHHFGAGGNVFHPALVKTWHPWTVLRNWAAGR